jgi:hypothetical protein
VRLDPVAVAAAFFVLDHLAGCGQAGDAPAGGAHIGAYHALGGNQHKPLSVIQSRARVRPPITRAWCS